MQDRTGLARSELGVEFGQAKVLADPAGQVAGSKLPATTAAIGTGPYLRIAYRYAIAPMIKPPMTAIAQYQTSPVMNVEVSEFVTSAEPGLTTT